MPRETSLENHLFERIDWAGRKALLVFEAASAVWFFPRKGVFGGSDNGEIVFCV